MTPQQALELRLLITMEAHTGKHLTARHWNAIGLGGYGIQSQIDNALKRLARRGDIKTDKVDGRRVYWVDTTVE
jgi:hypothetical protein